MKSFTLIFLALINFSSLYSQTNIVDKVINYNLPKNSVMLTQTTLKCSEVSKSKFSLISRGSNVGRTFEVDNSLVFLNAGNGTVSKDHLDNLQRGLKGMINLGEPKFFTSEIVEKNNYRVLINNYRYSQQDIAQYCFYAQGKNDKILIGMIEYKPSNAKSALNTLNELLKGMTLK